MYLFIYGSAGSSLLHKLSLDEVSRGYSNCGMQASRCSGFCCGAQALQCMGSLVVAPRL